MELEQMSIGRHKTNEYNNSLATLGRRHYQWTGI